MSTIQIQQVLAVPLQAKLRFSQFANLRESLPGMCAQGRAGSFSLGRRAVATLTLVITPKNGLLTMCHRALLPGRAYRFLYPAINFDCLRLFSPLVERRILVLDVRNTLDEPLDEETLTLHPYTSRSQWLVTGLDLDKFEERSFYAHAMVAVMEIQEPGFTRVRYRHRSREL